MYSDNIEISQSESWGPAKLRERRKIDSLCSARIAGAVNRRAQADSGLDRLNIRTRLCSAQRPARACVGECVSEGQCEGVWVECRGSKARGKGQEKKSDRYVYFFCAFPFSAFQLLLFTCAAPITCVVFGRSAATA